MQAEFFEWAGSLTGLAGAAILASNTTISRYGWWLFLMANIWMILFAIQGHHMGLLIQQCGFTITSLLGIVRTTERKKDIARVGLGIELN